MQKGQPMERKRYLNEMGIKEGSIEKMFRNVRHRKQPGEGEKVRMWR